MKGWENIKKLSANFRKAILNCDSSELSDYLAEFPSCSCADASILLGTYLVDNGLRPFILIKGYRGEGASFETHYWLEREQTILDITADQFDDISDEIIITTNDSIWHNSFHQEIKRIADYRIINDPDIRNYLKANYDYILEVNKHFLKIENMETC